MAQPSELVFGTMRMSAAALSATEWADFLVYIYRRGVRTLHSSDEYDSFPLLCETMRILRRNVPHVGFEHVVKLAAPSFDDTGFESSALFQKIEDYRTSLLTDVVQDVQWMWRSNLKDETTRLAEIRQAGNAINDSFNVLRRSGAIMNFLCFPYTLGCADIVIEMEMCDGLVIYRNGREREFDQHLNKCLERDKYCMIIRPFFGGELLGDGLDDARIQLDRSMDHPAITRAVFSTSNRAHFDALIS